MSVHRRPTRTPRVLIAACVVTAAIGLSGTAFASQAEVAGSTTAARQPSPSQPPTYGTFDRPSTPTTTQTSAVDATSTQEVGLVYINTILDYGSGKAAGTGMILTANGEILTNHHVVEGATSISVEVVSTGRTYDADVVGYDSTHDVAVLQLENASGLTTVKTDADEDVQVGDEVTGVGNANGDGGAASAAAGTVAALGQTITVSGESGGEASRLTGLIQINADIIAGDSGGALYDADGEVIGMNTAASSGSAVVTGYAVPIGTALSIADQIESGTASSTIEIGNHGYLGIDVAGGDQGPVVAGTVDGSPAETAGITEGSVISSVDGVAVATAEQLLAQVADHAVGDRVRVSWTDTAGQDHTATVTLSPGPIG